MKARRSRSAWPAVPLALAFCAGLAVDSALRTYGPPLPVEARPVDVRPVDGPADDIPRMTAAPAAAPPAIAPAPSSASSSTRLRLPIDDMNVDATKGGFTQRRDGRPHEAVDILAPRNTPIHAVQNGSIARLFLSKQGGNTIYEFDPTGTLCYYYAHLDHYAEGMREGAPVRKGDVIGYVGTTGNAPPNTPHLHFAVFVLNQDRQWWKGQAIDPYPLLKSASS